MRMKPRLFGRTRLRRLAHRIRALFTPPPPSRAPQTASGGIANAGAANAGAVAKPAAVVDAGAGTSLPPEWTEMPRSALLHLAAHSDSAEQEATLARHFYNLNNFETAAACLEHRDPQAHSLADRILWARACLRSARGFQVHFAMPTLVPHDLSLGRLSRREARAVINFVYECQLSPDDKLARFDRWLADDALHPATRSQVEFHKFQLEFAQGKDLDVLGHLNIEQIDPDKPDGRLRYLPFVRLTGKQHEVEARLRELLRRAAGPRPDLVEAALSLAPEIVAEEVALDALPDEYLSSPRGIGKFLAHGVMFPSVVERGLELLKAGFADRDIYQRKNILRIYLSNERLNEASSLIDENAVPDTVLSAINVRGQQAFEREDYRLARECFRRVLVEDPADKSASAGLRFCLPRTGGRISDMLEVRDVLGYGLPGGGLPGHRAEVGRELTSSLLFSGQYLLGQAAKAYSGHGQLMKKAYGERFLNFEPLPDGRGKSLFVIADGGVSDEVRTAQFYASLSARFERVTISCDPRLLGLLQRSFPDIHFVGSFRHRKGLADRIGRLGTRSRMVNGALANLVTLEAEPHIESANYITFGQCLFLSHFLGDLERGVGRFLSPLAPREKGRRRRIGLVWRSHVVTGWRRAMYLSVEDLKPLLQADADFVSIQHMMTPQEETFCIDNGIAVPRDIDLYNDFEAIADLTAGLDLVIGLSTLPIELAAAVGTPVWMLGYSPENYFLRTRDGTTEADTLTRNSTVIAPTHIDFSRPKAVCVDLVMQEALRRLAREPFDPWPAAN